MIQFSQVTIRRGAKILLQNINWLIHAKQTIGLIGRNGSGKSSLFAALKNELEIEQGNLTYSSNLRFAWVAQETPGVEIPAIDYVLAGDQQYSACQAALDIAEREHNGIALAKIHQQLADIDGYAIPAKAAKLMAGLGFNTSDTTQFVSAFSGGWRVRLNLARALISRSDVLLLDEPTNHLDLEAVMWLEDWLTKYQGTLIIVSHDRDFLDKVVNEIAYIHDQQLFLYKGNYSTFELNRAQELIVQQKSYMKQQRLLQHLHSFVDRFKAKATKAKQAQSRLKAIAKMELVAQVQADTPFEFEFAPIANCPNPLLQLDHVNLAYGDKSILSNVTFSIAGRQRIGILGKNGAGKSSLIKLLAGQQPPTAGERIAYPGLKMGYFAQQQVDHLSLMDSPLLHIQRLDKTKSEQYIRTFLGGFAFVGDQAFAPVGHFSGGEKSRLALAIIIYQKPNLLLLDEPTNHLDMEMRNALSLALQSYDGSLILISHDRYLLRTNVDQFFLLYDQKLDLFDGDLTDYQSWLSHIGKQSLTSSNLANTHHTQADVSVMNKKEQRQQSAKRRQDLAALNSKIKTIEAKLEKHQQQLKAIELQLTDEDLYNVDVSAQNLAKLKMLNQDQAKILAAIEQLETEWLSLTELSDQSDYD